MKAIALLSGGLDSILAIKLMLEQNIDVIALNFSSPFCTCTSKGSTCSSAALAAKKLGVPLKVITKGIDYFKMVENPKFGYGFGMNPCIDCRIYLLRKAKQFMEENGASFLVTGEVVGQRPMSQKKHTLRLIEKEAGVDDILLRPLSAKLLSPTLPEREGWVDREKLLAINGRSRKTQMELANRSKIDYPCPSGGCLLTDKNIARRLKDLFTYIKDYDMDDIKLLRIGRHVRISPHEKLILARNAMEGEKLYQYFDKEKDLLIECVAPKGPLALIKKPKNVIPNDIFSVIYKYSDAKNGEPLHIKINGICSIEKKIENSIDEEKLSQMII